VLLVVQNNQLHFRSGSIPKAVTREEMLWFKGKGLEFHLLGPLAHPLGGDSTLRLLVSTLDKYGGKTYWNSPSYRSRGRNNSSLPQLLYTTAPCNMEHPVSSPTLPTWSFYIPVPRSGKWV
jgi:hypothetical protein